MEKSLQKRKEKVIKYLKNPYNSMFIAIMIFAIIIRLYYFNLTSNQPLWWDEAEYMNMARAWAFGLDYTFLPVRPVLFSFITAIFFKIIENEFLPRALILILSIASVWGMYLLGKEMYNKKIGIISSLLMSIFYLNLFFSFRLLVDLPSLTFFTFSAFLFFRYFKTNSHKSLYLAAIVIALGTMFRITTASILFAVLIYILITQKLNFLKKKELWIAGIIFILVLSPYLIWGYLEFNGFVISLAGQHNAPEGNYFSNGFGNFKSYLSLFPMYLSWPLLLAFIAGLFLMSELILGIDILIKGKNFKQNKRLFLLLIFLIPILTVSFSIGGGHIENRYIMNAFPAIFIIASIPILRTYKLIKKSNKFLAILFLILLLGYIGNFQLNSTDSLTQSKLVSFQEMKMAGEWLRANSMEGEKVMVSGDPMIKYYSKLDGRGFPQTKEEFEQMVSEDKQYKYFIISAIQPSPQWTYTYAEENNLTLLKAFLNPDSQPILIIYKLE
jgi:mannosyltransferase